MQSPNNQKYCVGCETWVFDVRPKRQKYTDVIALKNCDLTVKKSMPKLEYQDFMNQSVIQCLYSKLYFLTTLLNTEKDVTKIKEILTTIKLCMEDINMAITLCQTI